MKTCKQDSRPAYYIGALPRESWCQRPHPSPDGTTERTCRPPQRLAGPRQASAMRGMGLSRQPRITHRGTERPLLLANLPVHTSSPMKIAIHNSIMMLSMVTLRNVEYRTGYT